MKKYISLNLLVFILLFLFSATVFAVPDALTDGAGVAYNTDGVDVIPDYTDEYHPSRITFTPSQSFVLRPYIDGYYTRCLYDDCAEDCFFHYDIFNIVHCKGNVITMHFDDNSTMTFTCDENGHYSNDKGEYVYILYDDYQYNSHWLPDNSYSVKITVCGAATTFNLHTAKAPRVKSADYNSCIPLQVTEGLHGRNAFDHNDQLYFNYDYDNTLIKIAGQSVKVELDDGTILDFICNNDGAFYSNDYGCFVPYGVFDNQATQHWSVGESYNVTLVVMGEKIIVPITVVENPVKTVSFVSVKPIEFIENTDGEFLNDDFGKSYYHYNVTDKIYAEGNYINVEYKDGRVEKYYYNAKQNGFCNSESGLLNVNFYEYQISEHWCPGKTCNVVMDTLGKRVNVLVKILHNKPATPKVATTNEIGGVNVTWNKVAGVTKYNVYRRQGGYKTWTLVGTTTSTTLLDMNVKSGVYYCYSVRAYNSQGKYSDYISANTQTRKYMATPKLTTIYNHVNGLAIKWDAVAGITNGYRVYRRGVGSTYWTYLGTTKNLYFIDSAVKNKSGEYFRYTVIADGGYHSKFDTTGLYLKRLANPELKSAVSSSTGITVKWSAIKGTTGYYVYRKTANSTWTRVGTVGGTNNTTFLDKTAKKGTTYTYTVRAVYGATTSAYNSGISCYDKY